MKHFSLLALLLLLMLSNASAREWAEYSSTNFTLYSDASPIDIETMLEEFEIFRLAALSVLGVTPSPESDRLVIVVFNRSRDFSRLAPDGAAGFFYHSIFGPRMMIGPSRGEMRREILFHEYVHYLMDRHFGLNVPRWFSEGMAMVLESTQIFESRIKIGSAPANYEYIVDGTFHKSVYSVVDAEPDGMDLQFYVTSWLLTHYLMLDLEDDGTRKRQTYDYLSRYDAGEDPLEAFEASFGMTPGEMQLDLRNYARSSTIGGLESAGVEYAGEITRRTMDDSEHLYLLGDLSVERDHFDAAYGYFDDFDELESTSIDRGKVDARRSIALIHEERVDEADALIERLAAADITDPDVLADVAHYAFDRFVIELEQADLPDDFELDRAIEYGERAVAAAPTDLEALFYLGLSYELRGDLQKAADTLLRSYDINPTVPRLNQNLARVLVKGRQPELAIYLLRRLYSATHSDEFRSFLTDIIAELADGEYDVEAVAARLR